MPEGFWDGTTGLEPVDSVIRSVLKTGYAHHIERLMVLGNAMSQFADGALATTKPYISGSRYLVKMSDFGTGPWRDAWDGLYWCFVADHLRVFEANPRTRMAARQWQRMSEEKQRAHRAAAAPFLDTATPS
ncbi:MAG: hypothetical protein Q4G34_04155 [Micrococcus sp.]|nr:hypothetical protein [Micrococcus sp.]